ncbi:MAG: class I SAM-dependent methyltransferase [Candidatus Celaenobacter antarcticus]|nr:class I SAM-dependent methyltransferase [Candidatus Celaenobacter antarcticus]
MSRYTEYYDEEAEATAWYGPEILFGLVYTFIQAGQKMLDIGIGTGLSSQLFYDFGMKVYGMDISEEMLDAVRIKKISQNLTRHDLTKLPYPYEKDFFDLVINAGVFQFFGDLQPIFMETGRIMKKKGYFAFVVGHRSPEEDSAVIVGSEHTGSDRTVTMYLHSDEQINRWLTGASLKEIRSVEFTVFMDKEKKHRLPAKAYVAKK